MQLTSHSWLVLRLRLIWVQFYRRSLRKLKCVALNSDCFGPLLNSPHTHPDTVLTTMNYLLKSLQSFGMQYAHITLDMQLYILACIIKWSDVEKWKHVVHRCGMMHTLMSFVGCIGPGNAKWLAIFRWRNALNALYQSPMVKVKLLPLKFYKIVQRCPVL